MTPMERVPYDDRGTALTGWFARPVGSLKASALRGGIVIFPTIMNASAHMQRRAAMLAEAGFAVLIADFYGEMPADFTEAGALAAPLRADTDHYRTRLAAAVAALRSVMPLARLSAIGFCLGGQAVLELARAGEDLALVASFHGILTTERKAEASTPVKPRALILHGDADPFAPRDHVTALWEELDDAGYDWHFHAYSGTRHGFTDPASDTRGLDAIRYDASADRQAWAALMSTLDEIYG